MAWARIPDSGCPVVGAASARDVVLVVVPRALSLLMAITVLGAAARAVPTISTSDVEAFYRVYDGQAGEPDAEHLQREYIDRGSDALKAFAVVRGITGASLAAAIVEQPATFARARKCALVLPRVRRRLATALARLGRIYPRARFPPVTIVIGRGSTGGTTNPDGVVMGIETLCAADHMDPDLEARFVHLIAQRSAGRPHRIVWGAVAVRPDDLLVGEAAHLRVRRSREGELQVQIAGATSGVSSSYRISTSRVA